MPTVSNASLTLQAYRRRIWVEELFGDLKRHGFDLVSTHLRHLERLSRLTLLVVLLYLRLVALASRILKEGDALARGSSRPPGLESFSDWTAQHRTVPDQWAAPPYRVVPLLELKLSGK